MKDLVARAWLAVAGLAVAMGLLLFVCAGTIRYWQAWLYLSIFTGATALTTRYLVTNDRALLQRRMGGGPTAEKRPAQKLIMWCTSIGFVALLVVPALDRENTFTSATIEVAEDQTVISTGPYAVVRHPRYAGGFLYLVGTPLALGSYRGLVPIAAMVPFLIWRLFDEEHMLAANLPEYAEYRQRVRYRLVPFVW